jgi:hypothetical protein
VFVHDPEGHSTFLQISGLLGTMLIVLIVLGNNFDTKGHLAMSRDSFGCIVKGGRLLHHAVGRGLGQAKHSIYSEDSGLECQGG